MHCLSDSVVAIHSLVYSVKTSFLSLAPLLLSQILFFFFLTPKTSNLFPHSLYPPPPCLFSLSLQSSFLLSPVSFFLSLSLCLVKGPTVRRPGSCGFHANRLSGSGKSKEPRVRDRATEWERESARLSQASQNCFCTEEHNDNTSHPCKTGRPRTGTRASRIPSSCYA